MYRAERCTDHRWCERAPGRPARRGRVEVDERSRAVDRTVMPPPPTLLSDGVVALRRPEPVDGPHYWRMRNDLALVSSVMGFRLGVAGRSIEEWIASGAGVTGDDLLLTAVLIS